MGRLAIAWSALIDAVPLYPLYALLFADVGLSDGEISALLMLWSGVGIVAEVPTGALADRFSRRSALVASALLQAAGFLVWIAFPGLAGFAAGFVVWGIGGTLASGTFQALVYDGLAAVGAEHRYPTVIGRTEAAGLAMQVPVAFAASGLFALGGYPLVAWASVASSLVAAGFAWFLRDVRKLGDAAAAEPGSGGPASAGSELEELVAAELGYLATLRAGLVEAIGTRHVRGAVFAVAALYGVESLEEYFPLLAQDWGVPVGVIPIALLAVPLAGAIGAALGGWGSRLRAGVLGAALGLAAVLLGAAVLAGHPAGIVGLTLCYGVFRLVLVVADARLQASITGPARATVSSVANLGAELAAIVMFGVWALGGPVVVVVVVALIALGLARALRRLARSGAAGTTPEVDVRR